MNSKPATFTAFAGSLVIGTAWTVTHVAWTLAHKLTAERRHHHVGPRL